MVEVNKPGRFRLDIYKDPHFNWRFRPGKSPDISVNDGNRETTRIPMNLMRSFRLVSEAPVPTRLQLEAPNGVTAEGCILRENGCALEVPHIWRNVEDKAGRPGLDGYLYRVHGRPGTGCRVRRIRIIFGEIAKEPVDAVPGPGR